MPRCMTDREMAEEFGGSDAKRNQLPMTPVEADTHARQWEACREKEAKMEAQNILDIAAVSSRSSLLLTGGYGAIALMAGGAWVYNRKREAKNAYTPFRWRWWMAYIVAALAMLYKLPLVAHEKGMAEATVQYGVLVLLFGSAFCGGELLVQFFRRWRKRPSDSLFADVAQELDAGNLDRGLWTRLYAENNGDEPKTRAAYIRERARTLQRSRK